MGAVPRGRRPLRVHQPGELDHAQKKLQQPIAAWFEEAEKNLVLPLDDRDATEVPGVERPTEEAPREAYTYYPGASPVPESVAVNIRGCSYEIRAEVDIEKDECSGVIFAHGSRFGGHSLFIESKKLYYVYNFLGIKPEYQVISSELTRNRSYTFVVEFERTGAVGTTERRESLWQYQAQCVHHVDEDLPRLSHFPI